MKHILVDSIILSVVAIATFLITVTFFDSCNSKKNSPNESIESKYKEERDSISTILSKARAREQWYLLQLEKDSAGMAELKQRIKSRDLKIKSYEIKLKDIDNIRINNLDSFFIYTYPDSLEPKSIRFR